MTIEQELAAAAPARETCLTIGVFDGVHTGHKYLFSQVTACAREAGRLSGVITFRQHPQEVLHPETSLPRLTTLEERAALIRAEGVDFVLPITFTRETAALSPREFLALLKRHLRLKHLIVGPDFALGRQREGNIARLQELGWAMDFSLTVVSPIIMDGQRASSSAVRAALARGDMSTVNRLLGRHFSLSGPVVAGDHRGTGLGFPTANMGIDRQQALPADGVYVTQAVIADRTYQSVTSIGLRPTFDGKERSVEVFILDYQGDLYGKVLTISVIQRLRDEKRFASAAELVEQIRQDVAQTRRILAGAEQ